MIKLKSILLENRKGLFNWYKRQLPNWPDYVIKDFLYNKNDSPQQIEHKKRIIKHIKQHVPGLEWKLERINVKLEYFTEDTRAEMLYRNSENPPFDSDSSDMKRHKTQSDLIDKKGVSKEPIIVIKRDDGFQLMEGWHRTMQNLRHFPDGFSCMAWVCYNNNDIVKYEDFL